MKELMLRHFQAAWLARDAGRKVAFVTSGAPVEYLTGMDVVPVYPENHGAVCALARAGGRLCRTVVKWYEGLSRFYDVPLILRSLTAFLSERGAVLVGATYTNAWTEMAPRSLPAHDALADSYAKVWLNSGRRYREKEIRRLAALLVVHGVIFHANRSCKPYSFGQEEIAFRLQSDGMPCILMVGDMGDERDHAAGGWRTRLEAYLERLDARASPGRME